ncbi:MAG: SoxR reducing system RseC family protein [Firmicutes bacterium]|nr:SoxR reducing system RseC family protein [Bacillota bacterium]
MTELGVVQKVKKSLAYVEIKRTSKCEGCKACAFGDNMAIVLPSLMECPCAPGDTVVLKMPEQSFAGASLVLFLLPLALFFVGLFSGLALGPYFMLLFAVVFLAIGIGFSVLIDRALRKNPKYVPVVTDRIFIDN